MLGSVGSLESVWRKTIPKYEMMYDDDDMIWALFNLALSSLHVSGAGILTMSADSNLASLDQ